jgi:class 3 adenylate cyclase/dihydrofolate reductase
MRLIVTAFMTLDGVVEGPGFDEHRDGKNAWALRVQGEDDEEVNKARVFNADALLLGRKTYQIWAAFWPSARGDDELVKRMNEIRKYVVSTTLTKADWNNSTIISRDVAGEVARLKQAPGGDLVVYGSPDLVDELLKHDLIDEYQLLLYPTILGSGKHLFRDGIDTHNLRLVSSRTFSSGVVLLTYRPDSSVLTSPYLEAYSWTEEQYELLQAAQNADRVLATVLFTDLVGSTTEAARRGDREWRRLLDRHDELARQFADRWRGRVVKSTGDGILATFDAPTRALRCAFDLQSAVAKLGLKIRAAIHTGEIEQRDGDIGGIAVHIAARVLGEASANQVVITRTVIDLATGTDLDFTPLGKVGLQGVPGTWDLFEASLR